MSKIILLGLSTICQNTVISDPATQEKADEGITSMDYVICPTEEVHKYK
jgi:hypothetical protein